MEKPARRSILNLEYKKSTELCRTTSPVMTRKKGRRRSSAKTPPVEEVKEVKVNNDVGLSFVKRKESVTKDVDESDRKKGTRRRSSTGRRRSSAPSADESIQSDIGNDENNTSVDENRTQSNELGKQSRKVGQRKRSSPASLTSQAKSPVNPNDDNLSINDENTASKNTSQELIGKTGASFEELLNAIDKEFGNKEFFIKTIDKIDTISYESLANDNIENDIYCNGKSTREEIVNEIDNQSDDCRNHSPINNIVDRTRVNDFGNEDHVTEKQQISGEKCIQEKDASIISENNLGTSEIVDTSENRNKEKERRISLDGINDIEEKEGSHSQSKRFTDTQNTDDIDDRRKFNSTYSKENHATHNNIEDSLPRTFIDSNGYSVDTETGITTKDSEKQICSTEVHDKDIKSQTRINQDNQSERENQRENANGTKVIPQENSNIKAGTNDDKPKKVFRQFGMRNRPSKPWQPPPKTSQFEFGLNYTK